MSPQLTTFLTSIAAETTSRPPARILKQINRQNEDGSYSYGYENDDGSYKIETKSANGEIVGKYGYVDVDGKLREIEYGASKRGFEPIGPGIKVPPPTVHASDGGAVRQHENLNNVEADYDDGQYREDPSIYYKSETAAQANELNAGYNTKFETLSKQVLPAAAAAAPVPQQLAVPQHHQRQLYQHPLPYEATLRSDPSAYRWYRPGQNYLTYNYNPSAAYQGHINPFAPQYDVFGGSYTVNYAG